MNCIDESFVADGTSGTDPDLSALAWGGGRGLKSGERSIGAQGDRLVPLQPSIGPGQSPVGELGGGGRRKKILCVSDAFGALSFIVFCEFLAVCLVLKQII